MDEAGDSPDSRKRRYGDAGKERSRDRFNRGDNNGSSPPSASPAGFGRRPNLGDDYSDDEDAGGGAGGTGAAAEAQDPGPSPAMLEALQG